MDVEIYYLLLLIVPDFGTLGSSSTSNDLDASLCLIESLATCVMSARLTGGHRQWAVQQLVRQLFFQFQIIFEITYHLKYQLVIDQVLGCSRIRF